ncbi:hypothetical protein BKA70DRAFT_1367634 [Coprinopsis sp. MPI-PUGE-AT-0042]|nr:hypothetical protein BKA70DRAFT_1367634 [Coprinopsis sp. MPI-PUGE-AT-0042]
MSAILQQSGFPPGFFVIKNSANGKVLDVDSRTVEDGAEVHLWPEKEKSLVEGMRDPESDHQVFFIDSSGVLCSRYSGHAIDIEGDSLFLRHRRPITFPYPNKFSHPPPKFRYDARSGEISVHFDWDSNEPSEGSSSSNSASASAQAPRASRSLPAVNSSNETKYILTAIPKRKPRTILDDASDFFTNTIRNPMSFLGASQAPLTKPEDVFNGSIELDDDDVLENERGEEAEVDDSPELARRVRVIAVDPTEDLEFKSLAMNEQKRKRRTWDVYPIRKANARTGGL